ncbi:uncharacterized protein B0P05DRAFT_544314 [Gilbertella persicaria]|uniref:uncharacterized protein n=1 Tax=Gilbertella persicaria TaxID=101096 RepID=UPI00222091E5|nr:uncharacterized protein B0P05DRAFT_544314 [Gilbertella persicaria]KAI8077274.1 hypothetical protein B0P05DRAFT_544314 [Gilbertella persicaria]
MKAGRHRIYTNEQRKARNREAQAAFRDRRNKHTKTLEDSIVHFETMIKDLKESNIQTTERAEQAEERCRHLESELSCLQKLVQTVLIDNQKLQYQLDAFLISSVSM